MSYWFTVDLIYLYCHLILGSAVVDNRFWSLLTNPRDCPNSNSHESSLDDPLIFLLGDFFVLIRLGAPDASRLTDENKQILTQEVIFLSFVYYSNNSSDDD